MAPMGNAVQLHRAAVENRRRALGPLCGLALLLAACAGDGPVEKLPNDTFLGGTLTFGPTVPLPQRCNLRVAVPNDTPLEPVPLAGLPDTPVTIQRDLGERSEDTSLFWLTDDEVEAYSPAFDDRWQVWVLCVGDDGAEVWGAHGGDEAVPFDVPNEELAVAVELAIP